MTRLFLRKKPASRWAKVALGVGSSLAALGAAHAQTPSSPTGDTTQAERVIVTGSNIPTAAEVGAQPVTTVDQAAVGRTGVDDPQLVLQKSDPSFTGGGNLGQSNASINSGATNGGSSVAIRGLPTLVLLNGRRIADSAALAGGGAQFQDVNLFPATLVKRIEVLKDGASAIYGSDAVGGVVNVLLNDDFQGVAIDGRFGFAEKSDIQDQRYSGVAGFGDDHTRIVVAAQYQENDPVFNRDRDFALSHFTNFGGQSNASSNFGGNLLTPGSAGLNYATLGSGGFVNKVGQNVLSPFGAPLLANGGTSPVASGLVAPGSIVPIDPATGAQGFNRAQFPTGLYHGGSNLLDLTPFLSTTLDQNRTNAYASLERDIIDKHVVAFADFLYSKNYSQSYLAPQPIATNSAPSVDQSMVIPFGSPYNPYATTIGYPQGTIQTDPNNGYGSLDVKNRLLSAPRVFRNDTNFYRIVAGLKGEIIKDYNYEVAFNQSNDEILFKNFNLVRADLLNEAIAGGYNAAGVAVPATFTTNAAGQPIVATPAGNFSKVNGVILPALDPFSFTNPLQTERAVLGTDIRDQESKLYVIDGKLTGFPINLPAGPLGFAVGGEYRREELRLNDSVENFVASVPVNDIEVGRDIEAAYIELSIPVVSPTMKVPGVYSFDIDLAGRYENYQGTGDTQTPKASFVYRPIQDIALRGTYGKSFEAPNLFEVFGPANTGFSTAVNLGAGYSEQANVISGGNPNLGPTRADTWDAGIVISPHQVPGLTITGDFFHVEEQGVITAFPTATILQDVNDFGTNTFYSQFVHRGSYTGPQVTGPGQIAGNASNYFIVDFPANNQHVRESGVDFTVNYSHDLGTFFGNVNNLTIGLNGTFYLQYKQNDFPGEPTYDVIGLYAGEAFSVPQYKLIPYLNYSFGGLSASALLNYTPSIRDANSFDLAARKGDYTSTEGTFPKIRDYYELDGTISYEFGLNKPAPVGPAPAPKEGKDAKDGKDSKAVATSQQMAKEMTSFKLLDGLKLTFGVNNITNARPPLIPDSPDSTNTDAALYDPVQRFYYFVVAKKF